MTVRRSLAYSAIDSYLSVLLQLAATVIIARLLTPTETGVFAVAAVFAALASTFRDFGVAEYMIQERELTKEKIRAALTANIATSWAMGAVLFALADHVAAFYQTPGVADVMHILAINFMVVPFGAVTMAFFRRQLDYRPIFFASLAGNVTNLLVAVSCTVLGMGYMSLAWASLASAVMTVLTSVALRPADFPRWPGLKGIRKVIHFGKHATGSYILGQAGKSAPDLVIGKALDMASVGFFSRAAGLIEIFHRLVVRAVYPICLPYFAKNNREEGSMVSGYLRAVSYLTAIAWPFFLFLGIGAYAAVRLVYGPQWITSVHLAQILCGAGMVEMSFILAKEAIVSVGRIERSNLLEAGVQGSRICGLLAVIPFGLTGACWGILAASIVGTTYANWLLTRTIGIHAGDVFKACLPSAYIAVVSAIPIAIWSLIDPASEENYVVFLLAGGLLTGGCWLVCVRQFLPSLWDEIIGIAGRIAQLRRATDR